LLSGGGAANIIGAQQFDKDGHLRGYRRSLVVVGYFLSDSSARDPATTWIAIAIGVITIVYVVLVKPLRAKKNKDPLARPPAESGLARQRGIEREMSSLLVELSDMSRQMTAQLDTRAAKLETLIQEADEKIATLRALSGGDCRIEGVLAEAKSREPGSLALPDAGVGRLSFADPTPMDPRHAEVYDLADEGQSAQEIARHTGRPRGEVELILALRGRGP
jgi:hypothetical protein